MVLDFHSNGRILRGCNASFLALIPKRENPSGLNEYRPISSVGCIYKILAILLAGRLSKVMNSIISSCQTTFMKGINILDGVVVVNEILHYANKIGNPRMLFKVDFEKAYDSISWEFLDYMFLRLGFNAKWRSWIKAWLQSATVSVLVNGSLIREFTMFRGIRQGDLMAPFLFLIVAEGLSGLVRSAMEKNYSRSIPSREQP